MQKGRTAVTFALAQDFFNEPIPFHILAVPSLSTPPRLFILCRSGWSGFITGRHIVVVRKSLGCRLRPGDITQLGLLAEVDFMQLAQGRWLALRKVGRRFSAGGFARMGAVRFWRVCRSASITLSHFGFYIIHPYLVSGRHIRAGSQTEWGTTYMCLSTSTDWPVCPVNRSHMARSLSLSRSSAGGSAAGWGSLPTCREEAENSIPPLRGRCGRRTRPASAASVVFSVSEG
jgi:hypothetical protein